MHGLHARLPKNFVLEERLERYGIVIEADPAHWRGRWAEAAWPAIGAVPADGDGDGDAIGAAGESSAASEVPAASGIAGEVPASIGTETSPGHFREVRLDLGCGKGRFLVESARREPDVLFVGMDSEPICVAYAAQHVFESGLGNAIVVAGNGLRLPEFFGKGELARIHLNFPTPFPRKRDAARRLVSFERLMDFREVLALGGQVWLRTDSQPLRDFALTQIEIAGFEVVWTSDDARVDAPEEPLSGYEERLCAEGARVFAVVCVPGPAPANPHQTAELSLAEYLPHDLEELSSLGYAPLGMRDTVTNLKNRAMHETARRTRR